MKLYTVQSWKKGTMMVNGVGNRKLVAHPKALADCGFVHDREWRKSQLSTWNSPFAPNLDHPR